MRRYAYYESPVFQAVYSLVASIGAGFLILYILGIIDDSKIATAIIETI